MNVYEIVSNRIISELEKGNIPWHKGWIRPKFTSKSIKMSVDANEVAFSAVTGKTYSLLNQMLLGKPGAYATFTQISDMGGKVNKGEKASVVVFYKMMTETKTNTDGEEVTKTIPMLRYYQVFHIASQTTGIDEKKIKAPVDVIEYAEAEETEKTWDNFNEADEVMNTYFDREGIEVRKLAQDRCYYTPSTDVITLPMDSQFKSGVEYYATLFHESIHSTGIESRLNRNIKNRFGNENYAKEELVAEIGASCMTNLFKMETEDSFKNNVAYIQSWIKAIKEDNHLIVSASSKAEKAIEFIMAGKATVVGDEGE